VLSRPSLSAPIPSVPVKLSYMIDKPEGRELQGEKKRIPIVYQQEGQE
jgi:hypothetical protein